MVDNLREDFLVSIAYLDRLLLAPTKDIVQERRQAMKTIIHRFGIRFGIVMSTLTLFAGLLASCGQTASGHTLASTGTAITPPTAVASTTSVPTLTTIPSHSEPRYFDDRSTPEDVLTSFYNAIERKEYARAYSYWGRTSGVDASVPPFTDFVQSYQNIVTVDLKTWRGTSNPGAGQINDTLGAVLVEHLTDGTTPTFAGCYYLRMSRPEMQVMPPFIPFNIDSSKMQQVVNDAHPEDQVSTICGEPIPQQPPIGPLLPQPMPSDKVPYLDSRSTPEEVVASLYNAINSKEYVRAYSYWQETPQRQPFSQFQQGYASTQSVVLTTSPASSNIGAGQIHYTLPVTLTAHNTDGTTQTFVGCYVLHLLNPGIQTTPPFQPLGIESADIRQVPNDAHLGTALQDCAA